MKSYQVIVQLVVSSHDRPTFARFFAFEELLMKAVEPPAEVDDGHDIRSGEANILIVTPDARRTFDRISPILLRSVDRFKAAFRDVDGEEFTVLCPPTLREFSIA